LTDVESERMFGGVGWSSSVTDGPFARFRSVPPAAAASLHADLFRRALGAGIGLEPLRDLDAVCGQLGIEVRRRTLRGAAAGVQATLAPLDDDRFSVAVDPEPAGGWERVADGVRDDLARHRHRFLLAHELGHTLFYERSGAGRPRRRFSVTAAEEEFCDRFARALLLPDGAVAGHCPTPGDVLRVQRRYDVSLELCVRAFAEVHGERFFGLLVVKETGTPRLRPQWMTSGRLSPRWWAADWVQQTLSQGSEDCDGTGVIGSGRRAVRCLWCALPQRRQVLVTSAP
jgi:hypothetical protein